MKESNFFTNLGENLAIPTNRNIYEYRRLLGLNLEAMKGSRVLDIGSGNREIFAKQATELGISVVSMNPKLKKFRIRKLHKIGMRMGMQEKRDAVAGKAQEIPFADGTFDYEVALFSVPMYLSYNRKEYGVFFNEIIRTLKPNGKCYIFPIDSWEVGGAEVSEWLPKDQVEWKLQKVPDEKISRRLVLTKKAREADQPEPN